MLASAFRYLLNCDMLQPKHFKTLRKGENIVVPMLNTLKTFFFLWSGKKWISPDPFSAPFTKVGLAVARKSLHILEILRISK